jgi:ribonuclease R
VTSKTGPGSPHGSLPADKAIVEYLESCERPPSVKEVARAFRIPQELRAPLRRRLKALADRGAIARQPGKRVASAEAMPEVTVVTITKIDRDGSLLAVPSDADISPPPSIRIHADRRRGRAPAVGQQVLVRLTRISGIRYDGKVIRVLEREQKRLFGTAVAGRGGLVLLPATRGSRDTIQLQTGQLQTGGKISAAEGDLVEAELLPRRGYIGKTARIIANLGPATSPGAFSALALAEFEIRHVFDDSAIAETDGMTVPAACGRIDLRKTPFVTIDGADARDFDDAVWAEPDGSGWRIMVAIADVAHYVRPGTALDREAQLRGNSVYLPDRVVPMLPEALSNDLCSLRPDETRAAMVAEIWLDAGGQMQDCQFHRALIRSVARLTYDAVQAVHDGTSTPADIGITPAIYDNLAGAWGALDKARQEREPLALNMKERRVVLDDDGVPVAITKLAQSESQRLIEDFMIAANVAAASTLIRANRPCVFRVHDMPDPEKTEGLRQLAAAVGATLTRGNVLRPHHFNSILGHVRDTDDEAMVNEAVLRSQSKAVYSIENIGHFGLSLQQYAHFTSPIRRYADLLVHRALIDVADAKNTGNTGNTGGKIGNSDLADLAERCTHISETESRAAGAERRTIDRFAAALFASETGNVVSGAIAGLTGAGAFVSLKDGMADGFLPIRSLPDDYYVLSDSGMEMTGRHNGVRFRVGDKLDVLVVEVTPVNGGILLAYVDGGGKTKKGGGPRRGKPGKAMKAGKTGKAAGKAASKTRKTRKQRRRS